MNVEFKPKRIIIMTPTYPRSYRLDYLKRCVTSFRELQNIVGIIIEDDSREDDNVEKLLKNSDINYIYLNMGPTRCWGNCQRNYALEHIKRSAIDGIIYLADDDNYYDPKLFEEIRKTSKVSIFPVGLLGPDGIEKPVVEHGKVVGWSACWKARKFPVDMAGFAFNADLLKNMNEPLWQYTGRGGETEFIERIVTSADELEILCDLCKECYVWHNLPLGHSIDQALRMYRQRHEKNIFGLAKIVLEKIK